MAFRSSAPDLERLDRDRGERSERWDRDRFVLEKDRDRYGDVRERFEEDQDHVYTRDGPPRRAQSRAPSHPPPRDRSEVGDRFDRRFRASDDEEFLLRERRQVAYEDEPRIIRRRPSPPESVARRIVLEKERTRFRSPSPLPRRPGQLLRRQSSLDTFDRERKPIPKFYEREEYGAPARREREEYRAPPYMPIPLPRSRGLPPPRVYAEREFVEEIQVSDPHRFGDDDFRAPEVVREKEVIRTRRRNRSRESRTSRATSHSHRGRSRSSSKSSVSVSSSSSGGTAVTSKSEYPKKGKTRIPARLVSKRALIELGYPYVEEGNTIIVQKALGQQNIDEVLRLSDEYKKSELEISAARSSAGDIIEERRTEIIEVPSRPPTHHSHRSHPGTVILTAKPRSPSPPVEVVKTTVVREVSPSSRSYATTSYGSGSYSTTSYDTSTTVTPYVVDARPREVSDEIAVGPLALVTTADHSRHHHRDSSHSDDLRHEIRHLEKQLARRERHEHRSSSSRDVVRAERLSTGELVLYEEEVERVVEPSRGVRIEKDKKGRMSISVPKYR
ncbi:hypothetical protein B0T22DRAFT_282281 [Podospora appendiculata]|uniref:DUF8035 domain-containing protein n=1 Tax=Podospora appendiculata TaxID=314037 RepID=A0AAE0X0W1_9PEZI|nr:hypothetical protein B0T22DRAFT_282281 [Podospora appendiculata]